MSSDLFVFDEFFSYPFSSFTDSSTDIFPEFQENSRNTNNLIQEKPPSDETNSWEKVSSAIFSSSSSPPSFQLENLSISQSNLENAKYPFSEVKLEEFPVPFESFSCYNNNNYNSSFMPQSYDGGSEIAMKFMQRSFSSNGKSNSLRQPGVSECSNLQKNMLNSSESCLSSGKIRKVCSTGDLQVRTKLQIEDGLCYNPLSIEKSLLEEANFKVGRYSAEERKERIHRYRAKKTQRNFNKTIKYACRKTLADNRPRIRGRFARNDETGEIPKASIFNRYEDEDDHLWIDGFHEEDEEGITGGGPLFNNFGSTQYQNYDFR